MMTPFVRIQGVRVCAARALVRRPLPALVLGLTVSQPVINQAQAQGADERRELAPTGVLRFGLIYNNANIASQDPATGELQGVGVELGQELAGRLGVPLAPVGYRTASDAVEGERAGEVDAIISALDPSRSAEFDFSPPYLDDDQTYIVRADSPIRTAADADRPGVRIAATPGSTFYLVLQRQLRNAELVGIDRSVVFPELEAGRVQAHASNRSNLVVDVAQRPGYRLVEGRFGVSEFAVMLPQGRPAAAAFVTRVVEKAKASGLVQAAVERAGLQGVQVAPPSTRQPAPVQLPRA